ncbi:MAG TPA: NAD(P) transhydrogenase subunit alpha [Micromonosporaceae bacterium]
MKIVIPRETRPAEARVALVPERLRQLTGAGLTVLIEPGAGLAAGIPDEEYTAAGALVEADAITGADVLLSVQPPTPEQVRRLADAAITISFLPTAEEPDLIAVLRDTGRTAFAMELIPRISRAQAMDALSSQAIIAGYRAGLVAAQRLPRFLPMQITAAGTLPPARALVLGAGVAGLQAIATVRRLGAVVKAYDVRAAAAEEVRSVGAEFINLDLPTLEGAQGYARQMTEERARAQRELLTPYVAEADALICTAAVPGRRAPVLVTKDMVAGMRRGSVVVDLAAESGGNVEGSVPGEETTIGGALVWGARNVPSQMPRQASQLYAANVSALLLLMTRDGVVRPDFADEVVAGACVTHQGEIRHAATAAALDAQPVESR